jgi:uncharacterized membrane protein
LWWTATALSLAGVLVAGNMLQASLRGIAPICLAGDCSRVAASPTSRLLGLPISAWGLSMFAALAAMAVTGLRQPAAGGRWSVRVFGLSLFGTLFIGYIVWYQAAILGAVCASCTISLLLLISLTLTAWLVSRHPAPSRGEDMVEHT